MHTIDIDTLENLYEVARVAQLCGDNEPMAIYEDMISRIMPAFALAAAMIYRKRYLQRLYDQQTAGEECNLGGEKANGHGPDTQRHVGQTDRPSISR